MLSCHGTLAVDPFWLLGEDCCSMVSSGNRMWPKGLEALVELGLVAGDLAEPLMDVSDMS